MAAGRQRGRKSPHQKLTAEQLTALRAHLGEISAEQIVSVARVREERDSDPLAAAIKQLRSEGDLSGGSSYRIPSGPWNPTLASLIDFAAKLGVHVVQLVAFGSTPIEKLVRALRRWEPRELEVLTDAVSTVGRDELIHALSAMVSRGRKPARAPGRGKP